MSDNMLKDLGITREQLRRIAQGRRRKPKILPIAITDKVFTFGVVSDTHLGSNEERLDELHTFYDICRREKIAHVLHAGDLVAGTNVYRGQENEIHVYGFARQLNYAAKHYPLVPGITTHFITGNHDLVYWVRAGVDIGEALAFKRPDMIYYGQDCADVPVGGIKVRLLHPGGGSAYADSYHLQRNIASLEGGTKPQVLIMGHYHRSLYLFNRNIHGLLAGTFEGQTTFQLRKNISPTVGGWTIKMRIAKDSHNSVVAVTPTFIPFF